MTTGRVALIGGGTGIAGGNLAALLVEQGRCTGSRAGNPGRRCNPGRRSTRSQRPGCRAYWNYPDSSVLLHGSGSRPKRRTSR
jgi:hypothetical protein